MEREDINSETIESKYEIESAYEEFFMELHIMANCLRINLAFYNSDYQYSYDGVVEREFFTEQEQNIEFTNLVPNFRANLRKNQVENVFIYKQENVEQGGINALAGPTILLDTYGIVHETYDFPGNDISDDIWNNYWDPDTTIEYGIYRYLPSESQVKSDFQVYNKDSYTIGSTYMTQKDILAYHIDSHGGPNWYTYEWQQIWVWNFW